MANRDGNYDGPGDLLSDHSRPDQKSRPLIVGRELAEPVMVTQPVNPDDNPPAPSSVRAAEGLLKEAPGNISPQAIADKIAIAHGHPPAGGHSNPVNPISSGSSRAAYGVK